MNEFSRNTYAPLPLSTGSNSNIAFASASVDAMVDSAALGVLPSLARSSSSGGLGVRLSEAGELARSWEGVRATAAGRVGSRSSSIAAVIMA